MGLGVCGLGVVVLWCSLLVAFLGASVVAETTSSEHHRSTKESNHGSNQRKQSGCFLFALWNRELSQSQLSVPKFEKCLMGSSRELGFWHGVENFFRGTQDKNKENPDKHALPGGLALCAATPNRQPVAETARTRPSAGAKARLCSIVVSLLGAVWQGTLARRFLAGKHLAGEVVEQSLRLGLPRVALPGAELTVSVIETKVEGVIGRRVQGGMQARRNTESDGG